MINQIFTVIESLFFLYFLLIVSINLLLLFFALLQIYINKPKDAANREFNAITGFEPPVSLVAPAFNEQVWIEEAAKCLLQLAYSSYEIIIVNDGSNDDTFKVLMEKFKLVPCTLNDIEPIGTKGAIRGVYQSLTEPKLRVVDKEAGGSKADASNAGLNYVRYPYFADIDIDTVFQMNSIHEIMKAFSDPEVVAAGGVVRTVNGSMVSSGLFMRAELAAKAIAVFQTLEYLRAFIFGRLGWNPLNAVLIVSGAFGVFRTDVVKELNGYDIRAAGEDMDLIVRIHKYHILNKLPYKIEYVPISNCYTEVPEKFHALSGQRARWHRGLTQVLVFHKELFFHPNGGFVSWLAFPYYFLIEWFSPLMEVAGFFVILIGAALGLLSIKSMLLFMFIAFNTGLLTSLFALLYEEIWFGSFGKLEDSLRLIFFACIENLGYHQFILFSRLLGLWQIILGQKFIWKSIPRSLNIVVPD